MIAFHLLPALWCRLNRWRVTSHVGLTGVHIPCWLLRYSSCLLPWIFSLGISKAELPFARIWNQLPFIPPLVAFLVPTLYFSKLYLKWGAKNCKHLSVIPNISILSECCTTKPTDIWASSVPSYWTNVKQAFVPWSEVRTGTNCNWKEGYLFPRTILWCSSLPCLQKGSWQESQWACDSVVCHQALWISETH